MQRCTWVFIGVATGTFAMALAISPVGPEGLPRVSSSESVTDRTPAPHSAVNSGSELRREELTEDAEAPSPADFATQVEAILDLSATGVEAARSGDEVLFRDIENQVRGAIDDLEATIDDAPEQAVVRWSLESTEARNRARNALYLHLARRGLTARHGRSQEGSPFERLDRLIERILLRSVEHQKVAHHLVRHLLSEQPFLTLAHGTTLEELSYVAIESEWLVQPIADLLFTQWTNAVRSGERTADEQRRLALALRDDERRTHKIAAQRWLFDSLTGAEREALIRDLLRAEDRDAARALARSAVELLPSNEALDLLERLHPLLDIHAFESLTAIVQRDPESIGEHYGQMIAMDRAPPFREELLAAMFVGSDSVAGSIAREALLFEEAASPRERALLLAAKSLPGDELENWFSASLIDQRLGTTADRLGLVAAALLNVAQRSAQGRGSDRQLVESWAARLESDQELTASARDLLREARVLAQRSR